MCLTDGSYVFFKVVLTRLVCGKDRCLHLLAVEDGEAEAAGNGDGTANDLGQREGLARGEEVQGDEDDDALEGVANGGGYGAEGAQHLVLQLVVHVEGKAAEEEVLEEATLVLERVVGGQGVLEALEGQHEGNHDERREQRGEGVLVGGVKVGAVLEVMGQVLAQDGAQGKANVGAHGQDGGLGGQLLAHDLGVQVAQCGRVGHTVRDGQQASSGKGLGHNAVDNQIEDRGYHGLAGLDDMGEGSASVLEHGDHCAGVAKGIKAGNGE